MKILNDEICKYSTLSVWIIDSLNNLQDPKQRQSNWIIKSTCRPLKTENENRIVKLDSLVISYPGIDAFYSCKSLKKYEFQRLEKNTFDNISCTLW